MGQALKQRLIEGTNNKKVIANLKVTFLYLESDIAREMKPHSSQSATAPNFLKLSEA